MACVTLASIWQINWRLYILPSCLTPVPLVLFLFVCFFCHDGYISFCLKTKTKKCTCSCILMHEQMAIQACMHPYITMDNFTSQWAPLRRWLLWCLKQGGWHFCDFKKTSTLFPIEISIKTILSGWISTWSHAGLCICWISTLPSLWSLLSVSLIISIV